MSAAGASSTTSNNVYILTKDHSWIPAQVLEYLTEGKKEQKFVRVSIPQYKEENEIQSDGGRNARGAKEDKIALATYANQQLPLQNVNEKGVLNQVEDMVDLPFLHEVRDDMLLRVVQWLDGSIGHAFAFEHQSCWICD